MGAFEFLLALASVLIGLAITNLVMGAHKLLRARGRVAWGWLTPLAGLLMLLKLVAFWWSLWALKPFASAATYQMFLGEIVDLALLCLLSSTALPDDVPAEGLDLKAFYASNITLFWGLFAAFQGFGIAIQAGRGLATGAEIGPLAIAMIPNLVVTFVASSMLFVRHRVWHGLGLVGLAALYLLLHLDTALGPV